MCDKQQSNQIGKGIACAAICALAGYCVYVTGTPDKIWLAFVAIIIIW